MATAEDVAAGIVDRMAALVVSGKMQKQDAAAIAARAEMDIYARSLSALARYMTATAGQKDPAEERVRPG